MITEFLYLLAEEIQTNQRLANKFFSSWKKLVLEAKSIPTSALLSESASEIVTETAKKKKTPVKEYLFPDGFDAFQIYYEKGSPGLYHSMTGFSVDELKGVLVHFTNLPRESFVKKRDPQLLLDMAVEGVKKMAGRSQAFGDYKMPK